LNKSAEKDNEHSGQSELLLPPREKVRSTTNRYQIKQKEKEKGRFCSILFYSLLLFFRPQEHVACVLPFLGKNQTQEKESYTFFRFFRN
jgi:hypothetical protein